MALKVIKMNSPYNFKRCSICGEWKVASEKFFYKHKSAKFGITSWCRDCKREEIRKRVDKTKQKYTNNLNFTNEERRKKIRKIMFLGDIPYINETCTLIKKGEK